MTIQDLINESKRMLLDFKQKPQPQVPKYELRDFHRKYLDPPRIHKCFNLLAPVGYQFGDVITEWFPPYIYGDMDTDYDGWDTIVVHGHQKGKVCQNRDLCHILGFIPVGNEHPWFLKEWEKFNYA